MSSIKIILGKKIVSTGQFSILWSFGLCRVIFNFFEWLELDLWNVSLRHIHNFRFICLGCCLSQDFLRSRFIIHFCFVAPAWCVSGVPCYSRSLVCWRFSGALDLLTIIWPDVWVGIPLELPPSSLQRSVVASPVVAQPWQRRRDKRLVLEMMIHHPSYLLFLTCGVVLDKSTLRTSKSLVVVVTYISEWKYWVLD